MNTCTEDLQAFKVHLLHEEILTQLFWEWKQLLVGPSLFSVDEQNGGGSRKLLPLLSLNLDRPVLSPVKGELRPLAINPCQHDMSLLRPQISHLNRMWGKEANLKTRAIGTNVCSSYSHKASWGKNAGCQLALNNQGIMFEDNRLQKLHKTYLC